MKYAIWDDYDSSYVTNISVKSGIVWWSCDLVGRGMPPMEFPTAEDAEAAIKAWMSGYIGDGASLRVVTVEDAIVNELVAEL